MDQFTNTGQYSTVYQLLQIVKVGTRAVKGVDGSYNMLIPLLRFILLSIAVNINLNININNNNNNH